LGALNGIVKQKPETDAALTSMSGGKLDLSVDGVREAIWKLIESNITPEQYNILVNSSNGTGIQTLITIVFQHRFVPRSEIDESQRNFIKKSFLALNNKLKKNGAPPLTKEIIEKIAAQLDTLITT